MRCIWMLPSLLSGGKEPSTAVSMHGGDSVGSHYHDRWQAGGWAATRSQQGHHCRAWTQDDPWVFNSRQPSAELQMLPGIQGRKANRKHLYSGLSLSPESPATSRGAGLPAGQHRRPSWMRIVSAALPGCCSPPHPQTGCVWSWAAGRGELWRALHCSTASSTLALVLSHC